MTRARRRIARVEAHRPRPPVPVVASASGQDRTADLDAWVDRVLGVLDNPPPPARG